MGHGSALADSMPAHVQALGRFGKSGLTRKAHVLASRWPTAIDETEFKDHLVWLRERRNSFAHRLIDDGDHRRESGVPALIFDSEMADEALERAGSIAWMLEEGWEQQLTT